MRGLLEIPAPKLPPLYAKQREAIECRARYTIIEATTKAGKTAGCLAWILKLAWNGYGHNRNYWWVAPVIPQAKIAFRRLKRMLRQFDPQKVSWDANETELRIDLRNGAAIWFKGSEVPDNLFGEDVYAAVIDEATRCKEESWHAVRSTLTATRGPVKIIGNVRGRKNWAYKLAQRAKAGEQNMAHFKLTAYDAVEGGILDAAEVEDAKRTLPESVFKELYLAEPSDDGGNPFGLKAIEACVRNGLAVGPVVAWGADLAKHIDWTVACGLNERGKVCALERWQSDWRQTTRRLVALIGHDPAFVDSTGVGDPIVEGLQAECFGVEAYPFNPKSKQQIMEGLASDIQQGEVGFPDGWLRGELESFEYEYRPSGVRYSAPDGMHDDGVCALALAAAKLRRVRAGMFEMVCDDAPGAVY